MNYSYDNADRLTGITQGSSTVTFEYDNADRRRKTTLLNGVSMEYFYDDAGQLVRIDYKQGNTLIGDLTYQYDAAGNRVAVGGSFGRTGLPQPLASAVYDAANRLTQWGGTTLTYDDNGNLTGDGTNSYTRNARDRLVSMTGANFQYDPFGRRKSKTIAGATTQFLYDGVNVVQELSANTANLLTGLGVDEMFTRTDSAGARHYLTDGLGSTLALANPAGAVQTGYTYEPYGKVGVNGVSAANPFQYTGRENDGTGLYYYRARYYQPVLQRFISEDPIRFAALEANHYGYVSDNPTLFADPTGLEKAQQIDRYLRSRKSPLAGQGNVFIREGRLYDVDPRFIVSLAGAETSFGRNITWGQFNAWNWGWNLRDRKNSPFESWASGIRSVTKGIRKGYLDLGFTTSEKVYLKKYCVGPDCLNGLRNINAFLKDLGGDPSNLTFGCSE